MKKVFFFISIQIILIFSDCQAQQKVISNLTEVKKAIAINNELYFQAFATGDSSVFINCYAKDCWIMQPNALTLCGIDAPLDFFRIAYEKTGIRNGKFITIDIFGNGDEFVTEEGFWKSFGVNNTLLDEGKFLVLWKNTPDGWKRFRDSFNSNNWNTR